MKIQCVKAVNVSIMGFIFVVVLLMRPISAQGGVVEGMEGIKIDHPLDVVIILDESMNIDAENYDHMVNITRRFPDHFIMGENDTRLAIITYQHQSNIRLNLTSDSDLIRSVDLKRQTTPHVPRLVMALNDAKDKVLQNERPKARKVIIVICDGIDMNMDNAGDTAKEMHQAGYLIYALMVGNTYHTKPAVKTFIGIVTGHSSRVGYINNSSNFDPDKTIEAGKKALICEYERGCRFVEPEGNDCSPAWWNPFMVTKTNCTLSPPAETPTHECPPSSCNEICDKKWPWESDHSCKDEDAGKNKTLKRRGPKPTANEHMMLENCPSVKTLDIFCPLLTKKPTQPIQTSQTGEDQISSSTGNPEVGGVDTGKTESAEVEVLVIVIGIIVALLCLGLIILAVLLTTRKRRKDAEKAAAMKAALEKSSPKSKSVQSVKKPGNQSPSASIEFGSEKKMGTDRAVEANLLEKSMSAGPIVSSSKTKSSSALSSSKSNPISMKKETSMSEKSTKGNVSMKK